jgi:tRNA/tmRNA/rRNA uracil-C5-methylase (TrmA/RlmC/RlmD family)
LKIGQEFQRFAKVHGGQWKNIKIKSNLNSSSVMSLVALSGQNLHQDKINEYKDLLKIHFDKLCTSLFLMTTTKEVKIKSENKTKRVITLDKIFGHDYLEELISDLGLKLGPFSLMPVNLEMTELMFNLIKNMSLVTRNNVLVDVGCEVGLYGLNLAPKCFRLSGFDASQPNIQTCHLNAKINDLQRKSEFRQGFNVANLRQILTEIANENRNCTILLHPGMVRMDDEILNCIKETPCIKKILFVSSFPEGSVFNNLFWLMRPHNEFKLGNYIALDMYPNTEYCEHLFVFHRK